MLLNVLSIFFLVVFAIGRVENNDRNCFKTTCDVLNKLVEQQNTREINNNLAFIENNIAAKHKKMKEVLSDLGEDLGIGENMPIQTYLIKYQKFLQEDIKNVVKESEKRFESVLTEATDRLSEAIADVETILTRKLDNQLQNVFKLANTFITKIDGVQLQLETKIDRRAIDYKTWTKTECVQNKNIRPTDCMDLLMENEKMTSGVYTIYPQGMETKVMCDMETDGGGWTIFLHRREQKTQEHFNRNWQAYKDGFGVPPYEYWMGNEALHAMTTLKEYVMRAEAESDQGTPSTTWGEWDHFKVESEDLKYKLSLYEFNNQSTMDNRSFGYNSGHYFTAVDRDNDNRHGENCANRWTWTGGFWYDGAGKKWCSYVHPTEYYGNLVFDFWSKSQKTKKNAKFLQLKLRPRNESKIF